MERTRTTLLLLLVVGLTAMTALGAAAPSTAATPAQAPAIAAAGESPCSSCLKCPCGCSPLAGAWVAKLFCEPSSKSSSRMEESILQTFKFAPVNDGCTKFVVNSQSVTRLAKVAKFFPEACDQTEFVGIACKDEWKDMKLTAISYGVQRCITTARAGLAAASGEIVLPTPCPTTTDKVVFIAVMTAKIEIPESCLECDSNSKSSSKDGKSTSTDGKSTSTEGNSTGECKEPRELKATIFIAYFDAAQDVDRDGFPDCQCDEAVLCVRCETCLKRVELMEPCDAEKKSFTACLTACDKVSTAATGRAFVSIDEAEQDVDVVVTVQNIKDVTKAALQINGQDVLILFPIPPEKPKTGDVEGLLTCAEIPVKDFIGSLKGKKLEDLLKAIEDGRVTVVVSIGTPPKAEICGTLEDP